MKKIFSHFLQKVHKRTSQGHMNGQGERGQILVIVTLSVIALTAIVGLAIDTGLLYLNHGKLRRAVDAAALAATAQFREGYDSDQMAAAAKEFLVLNGINDPVAIVETSKDKCKTPADLVNDPALCTDPPRKLVRVQATATVNLSFLSVIGIHQTTVTAMAVSEAASMDVVLVIDASESMTYAADPTDPMYDPSQCNPNDCQPFEDVKDAAAAFVERLYYPYDRVAIVTFDDSARTELGFSSNKGEILGTIKSLEVIEPPICPTLTGPCREYVRDAGGNIIDANADGIGDTYLGFDCTVYRLTGNPDTCTTTAIGKGLEFAGAEFGNPATFRQEALWVVILLTDGAANAPHTFCPNNTWTNPFCRDLSPTSRHCFQADDTACLAAGGVFWPERYDSDDYARDMADFVADEQGALIFTIGLGDLVRTSVPRLSISDPTQKCTEVPYEPVENCYGAGEQLMRYAAEEVGGGKYYFAPSGQQLEQIFLDIASNLATRLTR